MSPILEQGAWFVGDGTVNLDSATEQFLAVTVERHRGGPFADDQMAHLIADGPAGRRRRRGPLRYVECGQQFVERSVLVAQVLEV